MYKAFEAKSGSLVVLRPSFLSPDASPGVGIGVRCISHHEISFSLCIAASAPDLLLHLLQG